ncbi:MAG: NAD(P)H-hydrate dehydratase [Clostridiales bacterium]|nr:NAD(P)H-hydrate dehydratase [Clostridiales bacterium]
MMKLSTGEQMQKIDELTIKKAGIPGIVLMEEAAMAVARQAEKELSEKKEARILIVCGAGNNGGDGFAAARILHTMGFQVEVLFFGREEKLTEDGKTNFAAVNYLAIPVYGKEKGTHEFLSRFDLVIDALLGTGLHGTVRPEAQTLIEAINESGVPVLSVDIPSGVDSNTGKILGKAVKASVTVTFVLPKIGQMLYPGREYCGRLVVAQITTPKKIIDSMELKGRVLDDKTAISLLPKREKRSNKGSFGKLLSLCGSERMAGAAVFVAQSAYRCGTGLVTCAAPKKAVEVMQGLLPEAVYLPVTGKEGQFSENDLEPLVSALETATAVVVGPGLGGGEGVRGFMKKLLPRLTKPMLLDADGLNACGRDWGIIKNCSAPKVITPHPGEMARLTGKSVAEILSDPLWAALCYAEQSGAVTLLKDASTVIAAPDGRFFVNPTGSSALAKGGSGDVLSGCIAAFLAQGVEPFLAAALGAYLHGRAGELCGFEQTEYSPMAREIADKIPAAINSLWKAFS